MLRRVFATVVLLAAGRLIATESRTWWSGPQVTLLGSPSRDGRWLSFADPASGALAVRELAAGQSYVAASRPEGSREFAYFSVFSPDSRRIAYAWFNDRGFYELRIVDAGGSSAPAVIYRNEQAGFVQPCAWTADGKSVLTLLFRRDNISQIALVPAAGGAPRVLRSLNWVYPKKMDLSPDGRWIVYDNFAVEGRPERAIFILSADGSDERRLTAAPGNYLFPMWAPDGRRIYFAGDAGGPQELYALDLEDGRPQGQPVRVAGALGRFLPLGISASRDFFYGVRTGEPDVYLSAPGSDPSPRRIRSRFAGRNMAPAWAPDGKRLAFLSRRDTENFGQDARVIVVLDLAGGTEREVPARMAHLERISWSPDGVTLLAAGSDGKGRAGLFFVRASDGVTSIAAAGHDVPFRGYEAVWSPDGKTIYYLHGDDELRAHSLADAGESTLLRARALRHLAIRPDGEWLATGVGGSAIRLTPLRPGAPARLIPFPGVSELAWGKELYAGRGAELWAVATEGGEPRRISTPSDRLPGISAAPDGTLAFAAGLEQSEVRSIRLSRP